MDWQREHKSWPNSDISRFVDVAGMRWHVQRAGKGVPVLLLHGSGATTHSFSGLIDALSDTHELFIPDLPGHGFSSPLPGERASLPNVSRALAALLVREKFNPKLIVGHSAGAAVAVQMTVGGLVKPEGIVSINGAFYPFPGMARQLFPAMAKMLFLNPFVPKIFAYSASDSDRVRRLIDSTGSKLSEEQIDLYQRAFKCSHHVEGTLAMMANWDLEPMASLLKQLRIPMLQIIGEGDGTVDPKASHKTQAVVANSKRIGFEHAGHLVHEEFPDRVANEIAVFASQAQVYSPAETCVN